MGTISKTWRKKADIYKRFAAQSERTGFVCDFSEDAAQAMFDWESQGKGKIKSDNGYVIGKSWMDVQIAMWIEDCLHFPPLVCWNEIDDDLKSQVIKGIKQKVRTL